MRPLRARVLSLRGHILSLRGLAVLMAVLVAGGEIARRAGTAAFVPLALDELAVAALLLWAGWRGGAARLLAAWGVFSGLMLTLLSQNAEYVLHGREKAGAVFYPVLLALLLALGLWAMARALRALPRGE
ncbi:hypothetical protein [Roseomonas sp. KE0001]|uniref:hypothetical protein n=1 Tax=Roseomonas sp. KE0001 TaxID=2479201 RepID=UPI0018DEF337|nr:hypothetical protein [Roseomonas sp. KE0001]MBI0433365.1 hypothetical protein [Roseomonas sp. KE0001]